MGFDGILADEKPTGDLAVAKALSDEAEDFELAQGDAESVELGLIESEGFGGDGDLLQDDRFAGFGELDAEPDAEAGEEDGDKGAIDFKGVLDDEKLVLRPAEDGDEDAADKAENEDVALHVCWWILLRRPMPRLSLSFFPSYIRNNKSKGGSPASVCTQNLVNPPNPLSHTHQMK